MKKIRYSLLTACVTGVVMVAHATYSRVEQMGKSDDFFMDDVSIFSNPATIARYANFLTGELGWLGEEWTPAMNDPYDQWFGGAATIRINDASSIALGFAFNREDELVTLLKSYSSRNYLVLYTDPIVIDPWLTDYDDTVRVSAIRASDPYYFDTLAAHGLSIDSIVRDTFTRNITIPRGQSEIFLAYSAGSDFHCGAHVYVARQDSGIVGQSDKRAKSHVYRGDLGVTYGIGDHRLEASLGLADVGFQSVPPSDLREVREAFDNVESELSLFAAARLFYSMPSIGGSLVPVFKFAAMNVNVYHERRILSGIGYNRSIDGGLFYTGLAATFTTSIDSSLASDPSQRAVNSRYTQETATNGIRFNFGIEKNIRWDWFTVRVGGRKLLAFEEITKNYSKAGLASSKTKKLVTNPNDDGSAEDIVGFGVGFKFGGTLAVDGTVIEQFPYKNPFSWSAKRLMVRRISATYAF